MTLREALIQGKPVSDHRFDTLYPLSIRIHSRIHFTPVKVAMLCRDWLGPDSSLRLLDVGSGCGKFCLIAAAGGYGHFTGIEQRPHLVQAAQNAAQALALRNVSFTCGRMEDLDWTPYNAFYFFNPFYERIARRKAMDESTPPHTGVFFDHIRTVREKLADAKSGTRVLTYHGMGGKFTSDWVLVRSQPIHTDEVQLWIKS